VILSNPERVEKAVLSMVSRLRDLGRLPHDYSALSFRGPHLSARFMTLKRVGLSLSGSSLKSGC